MNRPLLREHALERLQAVARAARAWRNPEHEARAEAVGQTLEAPNRFTEEALAFAVNAATHRLTEERLTAWLGERTAPAKPRTVAVAPGEEGAPTAGLRAALAVWLAGHRCVFCPPEASPALVPRFLATLQQETGEDPFATGPVLTDALDRADAAVGGGDGEARADFEARCAEAQIPPERRCWRVMAFTVAVLDGHEDGDAREGLAEDALLYEGRGRGSVRLVWAPAGMPPDPYLDAMARFRAVFPAHEDTAGALQMQKAFLEAQGQSHAHGEGLEFLVSRGAPEVQPPGHLRWTEYDEQGEVHDGLDARGDRDESPVHAVVARPALHERLAGPAPVVSPGTAHRRLLNAPGAGEVLDFAAGL